MNNDHRPPDIPALAALLRSWAVELCVWLAALLGDGALSRALRRWSQGELDRAEQGAVGLVVLAALKTLPPPPPCGRGAARPLHAPTGFAWAPVRGNDMRRMKRRLFPRERDVRVRAARLCALLDAFEDAVRRLARHILRIRPGMRLTLIARLESTIGPCADAPAPIAADTS